MATLYQRKSDGRWIARMNTEAGTRHVTGVDREDVQRRAAALIEVRVKSPYGQASEVAFWSRTLRGQGCWEWQGLKNAKGYGELFVEKKHLKAHRVAYELLVGPIPEGLTIDHLCRNTGCVNPEHLEPVTNQENRRRAVAHRRAERVA